MANGSAKEGACQQENFIAPAIELLKLKKQPDYRRAAVLQGLPDEYANTWNVQCSALVKNFTTCLHAILSGDNFALLISGLKRSELNMKSNRRFFAAAALLASVSIISAGDIEGKITLKGNPPPEKELPMDANCGKLHAGKPAAKTRFYVTGEGGALADVFVYVKAGLPAKDWPVSDKAQVLDQVGCEYTPYVSGLQANQKLIVKNSDPVLHNVHPTPTSPGNKESNLAQLPKGKDLEFTFPSEEILLRFKCDVHPWMFAYVGVLKHPFWAVTEKDGTFKIKDLPPGKYTIEAYHRKGGKQTAEVTVEAAGAKKADFTFDAK